MLSIGKVSAGKAMYYEDCVARSREDYVSLQGEARGQWFGRGAEALELHGEVEDGQLTVLVSGHDPAHPDQELGHRWAAEKWGGYDLTFSAPKSVSVLYALAPPQVQAALVRAHDAAVRAGLGYMEDTSCRATRGSKSQETARQVQGEGFVAALYRHRVARPVSADGETKLDPQLHTHCIVANRTRSAEDGRWTALDMTPVYRNARTGGYTYQGELRRQLTEELGAKWTPVEKGQADIAIPDFERLKTEFSSRREVLREAVTEEARRLMVEADIMTAAEAAAAIDADTAAAMLGSDGMRTATLATREAKGQGGEGSERDLRLGWARRAATLGVTEEQLMAPFGRVAAATAFAPDISPARLLAEITDRQSTFTRHDLVRALYQHAPQGARRDQVDRAIEEILTNDRLVRRMPVTDRHGDERFSTPEVQNAEVALVGQVRELARSTRQPLRAEVVDQVLAERPHLSTGNGEQADLVRQLGRREGGIASLIGPGGSGKTAAFEAYAEACRRTGDNVVGAAFTGKAAMVLESQSGARCFTVHKLLGDGGEVGRTITSGWRREPMPAGTTVIVDEASMIGREQYHELVRLANRDGAFLVFAGDDRQLPPMDAGGPFRAVHAFVPEANRVTFTSNRRQRDGEERRLLSLVRAGDSAEAIRGYLERGQIVKSPDAVDARLRMIDDWFAAHQSRDEEGRAPATVLLGQRRVDVALLNDLARQKCMEAGLIDGPEVRHDGRAYQAGDRVICTRNRDGNLGVRNGQCGDVVEVDASARRLRVHFDEGAEKWLPLDQYPHIERGWAMTVNKAQGQTVDQAFIMRPGMSGGEWHYTALSRGRDPVRYYMVDAHVDGDVDGTSHAGERDETRTLDEVLAAQWGRSEAPELTLDYQGPPAPAEADGPVAEVAPTQAEAAPPAIDPEPQLGDTIAEPTPPVETAAVRAAQWGQSEAPELTLDYQAPPAPAEAAAPVAEAAPTQADAAPATDPKQPQPGDTIAEPTPPAGTTALRDLEAAPAESQPGRAFQASLDEPAPDVAARDTGWASRTEVERLADDKLGAAHTPLYDWRQDVSWSHYFGPNAWATPPIDGHLVEHDAIDEPAPTAQAPVEPDLEPQLDAIRRDVERADAEITARGDVSTLEPPADVAASEAAVDAERAETDRLVTAQQRIGAAQEREAEKEAAASAPSLQHAEEQETPREAELRSNLEQIEDETETAGGRAREEGLEDERERQHHAEVDDANRAAEAEAECEDAERRAREEAELQDQLRLEAAEAEAAMEAEIAARREAEVAEAPPEPERPTGRAASLNEAAEATSWSHILGAEPSWDWDDDDRQVGPGMGMEM